MKANKKTVMVMILLAFAMLVFMQTATNAADHGGNK